MNIQSNEPPRWYVLHVYSGYENTAKTNLEKLIENNNLKDIILDIQIPTEQVVEERNGKKKVVVHKLMPCYIFVKLRYTNDIWYMVTNTRGVTGFVGPTGRAMPLSDDEVRRLQLEKVVTDFTLQPGDSVKVLSGALVGNIGVIKSVDTARQKVELIINMFGRENNVEVDFIQVEGI